MKLISNKLTANKIFGNIARYIFLITYSYILLYPLIYIISNAVKSQADLLDPTVQWVPKNYSFDNFSAAIGTLDYWVSFKSTVINLLIPGLVEVASCAVAAYGLSRFDFKLKKVLSAVMIVSILVPSTMIALPSYMNYRFVDIFGILGFLGKIFNTELRINLIGTPFVFLLPSLLAVGLKGGLFIYIFSQFFKGLPKELEEAAWVDGAGPWKTFLRIIVPSSSVPIVIVSLFSLVWHWGEFYLSQLYLSDSYPLGVQINLFQARFESYFVQQLGGQQLGITSVAMAACTVFILPILLFYLIMQKKFVASISNSGIVG